MLKEMSIYTGGIRSAPEISRGFVDVELLFVAKANLADKKQSYTNTTAL